MKEILIPEIARFFSAIREDSRIAPVHISLFMAIVQYWNQRDRKNPFPVFSKELMLLAKISGVATYHKSIKQLSEYGYIVYEPSFSHSSGSLISIHV